MDIIKKVGLGVLVMVPAVLVVYLAAYFAPILLLVFFALFIAWMIGDSIVSYRELQKYRDE